MRTLSEPRHADSKLASSSVARSNVASRGQNDGASFDLFSQRLTGHAVHAMTSTEGRMSEAGLTGGASLISGHDFSRISVRPSGPGVIQTKLAVNPPGDAFEQEADRRSEQVMRMPEPQVSRACACGGSCAGCRAQGDEVERVQAKRVTGGEKGCSAVPPAVHEALRSAGRPLDPTVRSFMEPRFGHDFSRVRIHSGATADRSARDLNALAFTVGNQIVFGPGEFAPETREGRSLLAHELTHVIQQTGATPTPGVVQRAPVKEKAPFRDCTEATTTASNPQRDLVQALDLAQRFVGGAICKLPIDPEDEPKGSSYRVALERHFLNPSKAQRMGILGIYQAILEKLKPGNVRCAVEDQEQATCAAGIGGEFAAFTRDEESVLCFNFWVLNPICKAIILIHEAAHGVGVAVGKTHPPYRQGDEYPFGAAPPGKDQTAALRSGNPDAFGYFAAHVWRDIDTECKQLDEIIDVRSTKNALPVSRESKDGSGK